MKKRILFWWHYITNSSFRRWVYWHDMQEFMDDIEDRRREMLEYQSRKIIEIKPDMFKDLSFDSDVKVELQNQDGKDD